MWGWGWGLTGWGKAANQGGAQACWGPGQRAQAGKQAGDSCFHTYGPTRSRLKVRASSRRLTGAAAHAVDDGAAEAGCSRVLQAGMVGRRQRGAAHVSNGACREAQAQAGHRGVKQAHGCVVGGRQRRAAHLGGGACKEAWGRAGHRGWNKQSDAGQAAASAGPPTSVAVPAGRHGRRPGTGTENKPTWRLPCMVCTPKFGDCQCYDASWCPGPSASETQPKELSQSKA